HDLATDDVADGVARHGVHERAVHGLAIRRHQHPHEADGRGDRGLRHVRGVDRARLLDLAPWPDRVARRRGQRDRAAAPPSRRADAGDRHHRRHAAARVVSDGGIAHLFVYGTLRPGDVRWPLLAPYVADDGVPDSVDGRVYDTGRGYPAAVFDESGTIVGRTYTLRADRR